MEDFRVFKFASDYLENRIKEYQLYCVCKQIRCNIPSQSERDGLFKYLLDKNVWDDPNLTKSLLEEEINAYYIEIVLANKIASLNY